MIGLCPFHGEKSPSFNVSPTRNIFKCFGCGKGGDAINFLREHENMSFEDAVRWIAHKYNIKLEEIEISQEDIQERLQDILINAFHRTLQFSLSKNTSMRMAALMSGIDKVAQAHLHRGLYP